MFRNLIFLLVTLFNQMVFRDADKEIKDLSFLPCGRTVRIFGKRCRKIVYAKIDNLLDLGHKLIILK